ncbi:MAG TPA: DUF1501 domain-containing protein [Micromonosporaceae bacterium]|nr:DUF1501 domain-containing protein [Micromonosporaceae bacterium]
MSIDEVRRHGPSPVDAALRVHAEDVTTRLATQRDRWRRGFTRRRVITATGGIGVAALGAQLATTRLSFADPATTKRTLVVVFLRGGMDGLSVVVPTRDSNLYRMRPNIAVPAAAVLPGDSRFGLHPVLAPVHPLWTTGKMAAVHAVASPDVSRSHFQAQDCLERGAASLAVRSGWLDRVLEALGPGTTFRAVAEGSSLPRSLVGASEKLVLRGIGDYRLDGAGGSVRDKSLAALKALYTGVEHPVAAQAAATLASLATARRIAGSPYNPVQPYPGGGFADELRDVARLVKAKVGLRVAAIDVGGWDMHTGLGSVDGGEMRNSLTNLAESIAAFTADLGPSLEDTTVVTMSEFGRRLAENGNAGTDHGHGGVVMVFGGGLNGGKVHGKWPGLAESALDHGDVAGLNDYRDVLGELLTARLGIADLTKIFPGHKYTKLGVFK